MADDKPDEQKLNASMERIERTADRLHGLGEDLVRDAEDFRNGLLAAQEIKPGSQEDVFLRSIPVWERESRPHREEYVHMLADLVADGMVVFYHRGTNITPACTICDAPVPYLHATEQGYEDFKAELESAVHHHMLLRSRGRSCPGMCITGSGIEHLFATHQNMLYTAQSVSELSSITPIHIDYRLSAFRALDYESEEKFPFSLFTPSIAEQSWHMKLMLERNHSLGRIWEPEIEYHRIVYWQNVRDFPIGDHYDLATLADEARFQLERYPALRDEVIRSLAQVSVHMPK